MTPAITAPLVLLLHHSSDEPPIWAALRRRLGGSGRAVALDPGGMDAEAMVAQVIDALPAPGAVEIVLVGHGVGAAVAALAARHLEDDGRHLLRSLVLLGATFGRDEAWSRRVGVLRTPTLLVAAAGDADLQASVIAPHFRRARIDLEEPAGTPSATTLAAFIEDMPELPPSPQAEPAIDAAYQALIASDRVTQRTREVLRARAAPLPPSPAALTPPLLAVLRAVMALVLPMGDGDEPEVDIARRLDEVLASGGGDGWRHAALPPDAEAMVAALRTFDDAAEAAHGRPFLCLDAPDRQALLDRAEQGALAGRLDAPAMALWFSELRREAVRAWISHPAVLGRLGYSGIGSVGGDSPVKQGFVRVGPDSTEAWEPRAW